MGRIYFGVLWDWLKQPTLSGIERIECSGIDF